MATERVVFRLELGGGLKGDAKAAADGIKEVGSAAKKTKGEVADVSEQLDKAGKVGEKVGSLLGGAFADAADLGIDLAEKVANLAGELGGLGAVAVGTAGAVGIVVGGMALGVTVAREFAATALEARTRLRELGVQEDETFQTQTLDYYSRASTRLDIALDSLEVTFAELTVGGLADFTNGLASAIEKLDDTIKRTDGLADSIDNRLTVALAGATGGMSLLVQKQLELGQENYQNSKLGQFWEDFKNEMMYPTIDGVSGRPKVQPDYSSIPYSVFGPAPELGPNRDAGGSVGTRSFETWEQQRAREFAEGPLLPSDTTYGQIGATWHPPTAAELAERKRLQALADARRLEAFGAGQALRSYALTTPNQLAGGIGFLGANTRNPWETGSLGAGLSYNPLLQQPGLMGQQLPGLAGPMIALSAALTSNSAVVEAQTEAAKALAEAQKAAASSRAAGAAQSVLGGSVGGIISSAAGGPWGVVAGMVADQIQGGVLVDTLQGLLDSVLAIYTDLPMVAERLVGELIPNLIRAAPEFAAAYTFLAPEIVVGIINGLDDVAESIVDAILHIPSAFADELKQVLPKWLGGDGDRGGGNGSSEGGVRLRDRDAALFGRMRRKQGSYGSNESLDPLEH